MDAQEFYDGLGPEYDVMVSWEERLAREEAFFTRIFDDAGVHRVLDAACGTGMHVISFARAGRDCSGADLSPTMVELARTNAQAAGVRVRFEAAGFGQLKARFDGPFDAVTCLGNSLPHLLDDVSLRACLADFRSLLAPGGILVIQNRNYDRLLRERQRFMPPVSRMDGDGERIFLRVTDYGPADARSEEQLEFTLFTLTKGNGTWSLNARTTPLRGLKRATLESELVNAGFASVRVYGSYAFAAFEAPGANDLLIIARR